MKNLVYFIIILFLISGCKNDNQTKHIVKAPETAELYIEVMKIHDDVMPLMSNIHRQKRSFKAMLANDSLNMDIKTSLQNQISALQLADDKMMEWMAAFDATSKDRSDPKSIAYLKNEKITISNISELIHYSLTTGKKILDK